MGAEQSLIGGRKRSRSVDSNGNQTFEAYKAVRTMLEEQGKDFENQVFLDLPDARVLKRLGIFEDCDVFDDIDCKNSIKNIVIKAHGSLVERKEKPKEDDPPLSVTVPENIVVLFMGELGYITWSEFDENITKNICNKELVPNQIGLPGSTIPNVSLSAEYKINKDYSSGIFDCDLNNNDIVNQFEGLEHYLIPTKEEVIEDMKPEVKEMLKNAEAKAKQTGEKIIDDVTLDKILPKISEKIPKDKYGFVYVFSCLGVCTSWSTQKEIELYTKPEGLSPVRGYTVKKIPARVDVSLYSLGDGKKWNPVLTNDRNIIKYRNFIVNEYYNFDIKDKTFIDTLNWYAFNFDENWRNHLPDINSDFIQRNTNKLRKSAYINHFKFIDLLHEGDLEKIKNAWNMQFEDNSKFLLQRDNYISYSENNNLNLPAPEAVAETEEELTERTDFEEQENKNFKDNQEIFENIDKIEFESPENKIINLIKDKNLEDLKKLLFQYMKDAVDGDQEFKFIEYENIYDEEDEDDTIQMALNTVEAHDIYQYAILYADFARDDEYLNENKDKIKNALDIEPYIDYVNSDEYDRPEKETVITTMERLKKVLGFTDVQRTAQLGQGRVQQYGGMWQRGGFFMTCS
jgi:hypothetical protein